MNTSRRVSLLAASSIVLLASSLIGPRFAASRSEGLAGAGTAAMVFLLLFAFGAVVALFALVRTLRARKALPVGARLFGYLPALLAAAICLVFILKIRAANEAAPQSPAPVRPVTSP